MKMKQAWGWLAAGVLAAGLNASYYDGSFQWAHRFADRVGHSSEAVLALASGNGAPFLSDVRLLAARDETASCRLAATMARAHTRIARSQAGFDAMSAREEAQFARLEANRARIESQIAVRTARIAPAAFATVDLKAVPTPVMCTRVQVDIPQPSMVKMPIAPVIQVDTASAGPI
jgi:hypothetical protein